MHDRSHRRGRSTENAGSQCPDDLVWSRGGCGGCKVEVEGGMAGLGLLTYLSCLALGVAAQGHCESNRTQGRKEVSGTVWVS